MYNVYRLIAANRSGLAGGGWLCVDLANKLYIT